MFKKILIANRGEIAVRIAATARRLGIGSVAVYSDADRRALHVEACDQACHIGAAAVSESYLNAARILEVAQQYGVEAIHPGYGFLSENASFARDCEQAGIQFIGPPASAIEAMGSKSRAKVLMEAAGVALVPGYHGEQQDDTTLAAESAAIGFPQLIKASAGGGGKGMRLVESAQDFDEALASARRESSAAFGDDKLLIERYLSKPRHVEMQIFGDRYGNYLHLFERDCSIQRRHQKILEEAPAPEMTDSLRAAMGAAAIDCARAIDYIGAGTVEFLLDADGSFYFMEMNTRLQVEHPVSEAITGLDLVAWQLQVAAGDPLPLTQPEISKQGHAFEARIYAENPASDFMPAAGQIEYLQMPAAVDGIRIDTGVGRGDSIGINYDPMIAKLIAHGEDRNAALAKLRLALQQFQILGLSTNIGFLNRLVAMPEFERAEFDTGFIGQHHQQLFAEDRMAFEHALVMAAAALLPALDDRQTRDDSPWSDRRQWRMNQQSCIRLELEYENTRYGVLVRHAADGWRFEWNDRTYRLSGHWIEPQRIQLELDGEQLDFAVHTASDSVSICHLGQVWQFSLPNAARQDDSDSVDADHPRAPMSGAVVALPVAVGDTVEPGDSLMIIEAMKMEHAILAQVEARVGEILFAVGDQVSEGDKLVVLEVE